MDVVFEWFDDQVVVDQYILEIVVVDVCDEYFVGVYQQVFWVEVVVGGGLVVQLIC